MSGARALARRGSAGIFVAALLVLARIPCHTAITNPRLWAGTVPVLASDGRGPELLPAALVGGLALNGASIDGEGDNYGRELVGDADPALIQLRGNSPQSPLAASTLAATNTFVSDTTLQQAVANLPAVDAGRSLDQIAQDALSETERLLLEEGQRLSASIEQIRTQLQKESAVTAEERQQMLRDFWQRYARLNDIQAQFSSQISRHTGSLQPLVVEVLMQVGKSLAPLKNLAESCAQQVSNEMTKVILGPAVVSAVANLQALAGLSSLVEVADVVARIKATCADEGRTGALMKKALQHLNRAESDVVSAQCALDRIVCDALADRPLTNKDINLFSVEQHDLAVQLANVRSNLDLVHSAASRDVNMLGHRSLRWGIVSILLALAGNVAGTAPGVLAPLQSMSVGGAVSCAALNLLGKILGGRRLDRLAAIQQRHDAALAEHAALHAQFSQVEAPVVRPVHVKNAQPVFVHSGNVRQQLKQLAANVYDASASVAAGMQDGQQSSDAITAFRELISGLSFIRAQTPGPAGEAEEDTVRALLPLLDKLAAAQVGNATAEEAQQAVKAALDLVRHRIERVDNESADSRPGGSGGRGHASARHTTPGPGRSRRSGIRPPSVAPRTPGPASLSPAPVGELGAVQRGAGALAVAGDIPGRRSGIRPPSVAPRDWSATPPPRSARSMTPANDLGYVCRPPPGCTRSMTPSAELVPSRLAPSRRPRSRALSRTPEPVPSVASGRARKTPGPRLSSVCPRREPSVGPGGRAASVGHGARASSVGPSGRAASVGPARLEDELLKLVVLRMQVTSDVDRKGKLQRLAQQLQDATRAARQQLKASQRTEHVLKDCVDPTLAERILEAQHNVTAKTQSAMRDCLRATMEALEEECDIKDQLHAAAGMGELRVGNGSSLRATLAKVRAGVEEALEELAMRKDADHTALACRQAPFDAAAARAKDRTQQERRTPGVAGAAGAGAGAGAGVGEMSPDGGRKRASVAWQQFLQRQADATRNKLHRR
jgi:hypothetical protein